MAKAPKEGARVLNDLTKTEAPATPVTAPAEVAGKAKKNTNVQVQYLDDSGKELKGLNEAPSGVSVNVGNGMVAETIMFGDLPSNILYALAAFGANTVLRNAVNTTLNSSGGTITDAAEMLENRIAGFRAGQWARVGDGNGEGSVPLVIEALKRAYIDLGKPEDFVNAEYDKAWELYKSLDKEGKAAQTKTWMAKGKIRAAYDTIKLERAQAKLEKTKRQVAEAGSSDDELA